jgi:hypothetical protein
MNDQSNEDGQESAARKKKASKQSNGKQGPAKSSKFHFTVEADSPRINVTVASIDLKLPPPPWPDWPEPPQPDP